MSYWSTLHSTFSPLSAPSHTASVPVMPLSAVFWHAEPEAQNIETLLPKIKEVNL